LGQELRKGLAYLLIPPDVGEDKPQRMEPLPLSPGLRSTKQRHKGIQRNTKELIAVFELMCYDNEDLAGKGTNFCNILDRKPLSLVNGQSRVEEVGFLVPGNHLGLLYVNLDIVEMPPRFSSFI
jgi:hypothetical protein